MEDLPQQAFFAKLTAGELKQKSKMCTTLPRLSENLHQHSMIGELQHSFLGRLLLKQIVGPDKDRSDGDDLSKMIDSGLLEFPLRAMSLTGKLKPTQVRGLIDLLNGHFLKGIRKLKMK